MKTIFDFSINLGDIKGAISSISNLNGLVGKASPLASEMSKSFSSASKNINGNVSKNIGSLEKLKVAVISVNNIFKALGHTIRNIATNILGKLTSVLKTGLGLVGSLVGGVISLFNAANGSNRLATSAASSGLDSAGQKALENANEETGFNLDLSKISNAVTAPTWTKNNQGLNDILLKRIGINLSDYKDDPAKAAYDILRVLREEHTRMTKGKSWDEQKTANETFLAMNESIFNDLLNIDGQDFIKLSKRGVFDRHEERFNATRAKYNSVDFKALQTAERALDDFSETLKAFALTTVSKFLPPLTKTLKSFTGMAKGFTTKLVDSGILQTTAQTIGDILGAFTSIVSTINDTFSETTGASLIDFIKGIFSFIGNLAKLIAAIVRGDWTEVASLGKDMWGQTKEFSRKTIEIGGEAAGGATKLAAKGINAIFGSEIDSESVSEKVKEKYKAFYSTIEGTKNKIVERMTEDMNNGKSLVNSLGDQMSEWFNDNDKKLEVVTTIPVNIDGKRTEVISVKQGYVINPINGIIETGKSTANVSKELF